MAATLTNLAKQVQGLQTLAHAQVALVRVLRPPAVHLDLDRLGQLAAQIIDVDAGAAVHKWRVFACKQPDSHGLPLA